MQAPAALQCAPLGHAVAPQHTLSTQVRPLEHAVPPVQLAPRPAGGWHTPVTSHEAPGTQSVAAAVHDVRQLVPLAQAYSPQLLFDVTHAPEPLHDCWP